MSLVHCSTYTVGLARDCGNGCHEYYGYVHFLYDWVSGKKNDKWMVDPTGPHIIQYHNCEIRTLASIIRRVHSQRYGWNGWDGRRRSGPLRTYSGRYMECAQPRPSCFTRAVFTPESLNGCEKTTVAPTSESVKQKKKY